MGKKAIVIGAGIAGLATAIRLSRQGFSVSVYESNAYPGGKLTSISGNGYRFDAGPSLFTLPNLVDELFELCGEIPQEHFNYQPIESICNYFYEDGFRITAFKSREKFNESLKKNGISAQSREAFFNHLELAEFRYNLTSPIFIEQSLHRIANYLNWKTLKGILFSWKLNPFRTMNQENESKITDTHLVQYLNRYATYNGSNPYRAPALLNMIPHLEHKLGSFFPKGGMHSITQSIYELAKRQGVNFYFNHKVEEILLEKGKSKGIRFTDLTNQIHDSDSSDLVVCNADVYTVYKKMLPHEKAPEKSLKQERSTSALVFYWGIKKKFQNLDLHNIFFSADYATEFQHLFEGHEPYNDPTIYINITSKFEPSDAPEGGENWFVMINVPHNRGQNWQQIKQTARTRILEKLNRILNTDIESLIEFESILDPILIEERTASFAGSLYGTASNNRFSAFLRHPNFSRSISGLYFCGGSVHPGGGIPLCLNSAKIVSTLVKNDFGN